VVIFHLGAKTPTTLKHVNHVNQDCECMVFFVIPRTLLNIRLSYYFTFFRNEDRFKSIKHQNRSGYFVLLLKRNNDNNRRITFLRLVDTGVKVSRVVSRFAFIGHCIDRSG